MGNRIELTMQVVSEKTLHAAFGVNGHGPDCTDKQPKKKQPGDTVRLQQILDLLLHKTLGSSGVESTNDQLESSTLDRLGVVVLVDPSPRTTDWARLKI